MRNPRTMLYFYVLLLFVFTFMTWACSAWGTEWGQRLAKQTEYLTLISHIALVLSMIGAVSSQVVAVAQYEDADVRDVLDEVKKD